jgi:hypothetical protein
MPLKIIPYCPTYCVAVDCALQEGEILGFRKQDILLDRGLLKVDQVVSSLRGKHSFGYPKAEKSKCIVGLQDFVFSEWENPGLILNESRKVFGFATLERYGPNQWTLVQVPIFFRT